MTSRGPFQSQTFVTLWNLQLKITLICVVEKSNVCFDCPIPHFFLPTVFYDYLSENKYILLSSFAPTNTSRIQSFVKSLSTHLSVQTRERELCSEQIWKYFSGFFTQKKTKKVLLLNYLKNVLKAIGGTVQEKKNTLGWCPHCSWPTGVPNTRAATCVL